MVRWGYFTSRQYRLRVRARYPCILVDCLLGKKVEISGAQGLDHFGCHCQGCNVLLRGSIHFPLRVLDNPESQTGKCGCFSVFWTATNDIRRLHL